MQARNVLAIVPARGGSKRIPRKNIHPLAGRPLIAITIQCALSALRVGRVVVSTDDEEIAAVARSAGAEVPFLRPPELAGDKITMAPVLLHLIDHLHDADRYSLIAVLQPTSPLRKPQDIDAAVDFLETGEFDSVDSYHRASHPVEWLCRIDQSGVIQPIFPDAYYSEVQGQDCPPSYMPNGAIFVIKRDVLISRQTLVGKRHGGFIMPEERSVDIDEPLDLLWAEFLVEREGLNLS